MNERVFHKNTIEFITVSKEYVRFCEDISSYSSLQTATFLNHLFPLLYLKMQMLPDFEHHEEALMEDFVNEDIYNFIAHIFEEKFGELDVDCDIPETASQNNEKTFEPLSEILADVYQDIKNVIMHYQSGEEDMMEVALYTCKMNFEIYWGQRLLSALQALHTLTVFKKELLNEVQPKKNITAEEYDTSNWIISQRQAEWGK
jgi:hypothetical protein